MDNTGRAGPYGTSEQNDPNADAYPWVASLTGIGGTTDDYMRQYREQQQALERQLGGLSLGGSAADPDSGAIRRTSMGGSMRMPRQPSLRDNQISSARPSIDTSYAASSHSRSKHSTASSGGDSSFSEEPAIAPQPKKSGGLKSFLKTVKKTFVPSSGKKTSKDGMHQPEVVKTTWRCHIV
ncbi:hypothetical protein ACFX5Q_34425 [Mesorhizobium sp. IMUNJ 23033]|uniref:hypothetical protein n=1 Tax=Mesorhizobium sp. IMUNJ 23033 TaxID=3378039 RepID=UPI00384BEC45